MNAPAATPASPSTPAASAGGRSLAPPAPRIDSARLLQLILGRESVVAGSFPPEAAEHRPRAEALRSLDLHFTTAQKVASGQARLERLARSRWAAVCGLVAALLVGMASGAAGAWWVFSPQTQGPSISMPKANWRVRTVTADGVVVSAAGRLWPIRVGQELPNGERVVMVDEKSRSVVTDVGSYQLAAPESLPAQDTRKN